MGPSCRLVGERLPRVPELAAAVATAAEDELISARGDPVLANTVWLLAQLTLAARTDRFAAELTALGFASASEQSLLDIVTGSSGAVECQIVGTAGRIDLGTLARQAGAETLTELVGAQLPGLFGTIPDDSCGPRA